MKNVSGNKKGRPGAVRSGRLASAAAGAQKRRQHGGTQEHREYFLTIHSFLLVLSLFRSEMFSIKPERPAVERQRQPEGALFADARQRSALIGV